MNTAGAFTLRRLCQEEWPITSLTETGDRIGVTRERVRQLVRKHRIPTFLVGERGRGLCSWCKQPHVYSQSSFCVRCWAWSRRVILTCDHCGAYFTRRRGEIAGRQRQARYKGHQYCSVPCAQKHNLETTPNHLKAHCPVALNEKHEYTCKHCGKER